MEKIPIFVGDIHSNAAAMTQIINYYNPEFYDLYWLGDFVNSKKVNTDHKEIEYVLHMMLAHCKNVLHSNHMHVLFEYLHNMLFKHNEKNIQCRWKGWAQTKQVLDGLHPSTKRQLVDFIKRCHFTLEIPYRNRKIIAAHCAPKVSTIGKVPSMLLTQDQMTSIGSKSNKPFWKQKIYKKQLSDYDIIVCGHHGIVARYGNIRICDLRGIEVPTYDPSKDKFKIFPI